METNPKLKIFLVDDDNFLLNMYALKFSKSGYEVNSAQNAQDALKKIQDGYVPDVILLDVIMPGMSGVDLLEKIRKESLIPKAAIIMLTNQSDSGDVDRAKSLGIDGYIVKATTIPSEVITDVLEIYNKKKGS